MKVLAYKKVMPPKLLGHPFGSVCYCCVPPIYYCVNPPHPGKGDHCWEDICL